MATSADNRPEIRPLTGIRGFAAGMVLLIHFFPMWCILLPSLSFLGLLSGRGFLGVDLFFILSGFILNYVYFDPAKSRLDLREYRSFVWHRFVRVWPVHFATIALLVAMVLAAHFCSVTISGKYPPSALPFQLTMTHAWLYQPGTQNMDSFGFWTWNFPAWSISAEWFAYLFIFPILWRVLKFLNGLGGRSFLLAYLSIAVWALLILPRQIHWFYAVVMVTFEFATGALLYNVFRYAPAITRKCQRLATVTFAVVLAALLACPGATPLFPSFLILLFPVLLLGLTSETAFIAKFFATAPALWLGRISYSVYMTQAIVAKVLKVVLPPERYAHSPLPLRVALVIGTLLLVLAVASAFYYLVETPARGYLRKIVESKRPADHDRPARLPA